MSKLLCTFITLLTCASVIYAMEKTDWQKAIPEDGDMDKPYFVCHDGTLYYYEHPEISTFKDLNQLNFNILGQPYYYATTEDRTLKDLLLEINLDLLTHFS